MNGPRVHSVHLSPAHSFSKPGQEKIVLITGEGVLGDAHRGVTVKHRSRVARDPTQPNLRQVHLIHRELMHELAKAGFHVGPGDMGENVTTEGVDILSLPRGARLRLGAEAVIEITGLRNPCAQLDAFQKGLTAAVLDKEADGNLVRKAGVMAVVISGGSIYPGDGIAIELPRAPHARLEVV